MVGWGGGEGGRIAPNDVKDTSEDVKGILGHCDLVSASVVMGLELGSSGVSWGPETYQAPSKKRKHHSSPW